MAGFDELAGRAGVLPVKTVGDELAMEVGAAVAVEVGAGVGAVDPGTYVEVVVAAGDEVAVVAGVGAGDTIDTDVELATMTGEGVGVAMTGVGVGVAMTGGGGGATGKTGSEEEVVVITDAEVAMIN